MVCDVGDPQVDGSACKCSDVESVSALLSPDCLRNLGGRLEHRPENIGFVVGVSAIPTRWEP